MGAKPPHPDIAPDGGLSVAPQGRSVAVEGLRLRRCTLCSPFSGARQRPSRSPFSGAGRLRRSAPLCYNAGMRTGQTMVEYVLVLVALLGAALAAGFLVRAVDAQEARTETLLGSGYP